VNAARGYLRLSEPYAEYLGGLRWSSDDNVLELKSGKCFLFAQQVADFLEGFGSVRPVLHFALMAHLVFLLRRPPAPDDSSELHRLWQAFGQPGTTLRNAGAFCAVLCRSQPEALQAGQLEDICRRLRSHEQFVHWMVYGPEATPHGINVEPPAEYPPLPPAEFEMQVLLALCDYDDVELQSWFRQGRGSVKHAAEALARALPATLAGRMRGLLERPRLAGAAAFVRQLAGALTLPPRRLAHHELPLGGYADVTTRGHVDQILPSQFALDEWDFFRRYAERELLYFRREEPHVQTRQELLVLLDQGVRTWGDVRLALGAALTVLGRQASERKLSFRMATSSIPQALDPMELDAETLGQLVEATDVSRHPGPLLERVLEAPAASPTAIPRDIVLLTHPRNLEEADVRAAAGRVPPDSRLFALTLDRHGQAGLCELRHGLAVPVRQFQVDLSAGRAYAEPLAPAPSAGDWRGDVEAVGYPFRFGAAGDIKAFDFDGGELLLTAGPHGLLHLWKIGGLAEILPRALVAGHVVNSVADVLGVADGFVVVGHALRTPGPTWPVLVHYDLAQRRCTTYFVGDGRPQGWQWEYSWAHHCFIAHGHVDQVGFVVDLGTGGRYATYLGGPRNRAQQAWEAWQARQVPPRRLSITHPRGRTAAVTLDADSGAVTLHNVQPTWQQFTPLADGRPMLAQHLVLEGQCRGDTLALKTSRLGSQPDFNVRLFRGPEGVFLGEYPLRRPSLGFALSANGRFLARQVREGVIEVSQAAGTITPVRRTLIGAFPQQLRFVLSNHCLVLFPSGDATYGFALLWNEGELRCTRLRDPIEGGVNGTRAGIPAFLHYDPERWLFGAQRLLTAASDRYGQVALFDARGNLVCMFFAFRNRLAGWMPDGTRFGPLTFWSEKYRATKEVLNRFGRALCAACDNGARRT
jgi:hypothetical protein